MPSHDGQKRVAAYCATRRGRAQAIAAKRVWVDAYKLFNNGGSVKAVKALLRWRLDRIVAWEEVVREWNQLGIVAVRQAGRRHLARAAPGKIIATPRCTICGKVTEDFVAQIRVKGGKMLKWDGEAICMRCIQSSAPASA